ncbi:hypothetical protein BH11GEM2_BH11GEM2_20590 [soil metagenome]
MFDATYVINLDRSPDRWAHARRVTGAAGFPNVIRLPATDGAALGDVGIASLQKSGVLSPDLSHFHQEVRDGEIGCAVSHANVLRDIIARGLSTALILEDDVDLAGDVHTWRARFDAARHDLPDDWQLWYLYRCFDVEHRVVRLTPRTVVPWTPQCAGAYALTAEGARILLDALTPVGNAVDRVYMDVVKSRAIRAFAASPGLAVPAPLPSAIRPNGDAGPWARDGVNRPPEYWPQRYLAGIGERDGAAPLHRRAWHAVLARWQQLRGPMGPNE